MQSSPVQVCVVRGEVAHLQEVVMRELGCRVVGMEVVGLGPKASDKLRGEGNLRGSRFLAQANWNEHAGNVVPWKCHELPMQMQP